MNAQINPERDFNESDDATNPALSSCTQGYRAVTVPRMMRVSVMDCVCVLSIIAAMGICACEKHPLGQMPEVQREQPDPAKVRSKADKTEAEKSSTSPTPAEFSSHEAH